MCSSIHFSCLLQIRPSNLFFHPRNSNSIARQAHRFHTSRQTNLLLMDNKISTRHFSFLPHSLPRFPKCHLRQWFANDPHFLVRLSAPPLISFPYDKTP